MTQAFQAHKTGSAEVNEHRAFMEPVNRRVRVLFGGETIADSDAVLLMHETKHLPVYYFPMSDVRMDLMEATDRSTH